jgi:hypothetical protein
MSDNRPTLRSTALSIIQIYRALLKEREFDRVAEAPNVIGRRLEVLSQIADGRINPETMTVEQAIVFHDALLDAMALQYATGSPRDIFSPFSVGDLSLLGTSGERRSKLHEKLESQLD